MRALGPALLRVHDRLEQRAEDGRRNVRPVEAAGVEQRRPHGRVEGRDAQRPVEQGAVDIGEADKIFVERFLAFGLGCIQHLKQLGQTGACVRSVFACAFLDQVEEDVARLEDAGVVGEQAEDDPHQKSFQIVAPVARRVERIVQPSDQFCRRDIGGVLVAESPALHAENEAELLDVGGQVRERKGGDLALVEIVKLEGLKIADQDEAGAVALRQRVEILPGLPVGLCRDRARRFSARRSGRRARTGR